MVTATEIIQAKSTDSHMTERSVLIYRIVLVIFWMTVTIGFICDEFTFLEPLRSPVLLFADSAVTVLGLFTLRKRCDILLAATFIVFSLVSTLWINHESIAVWLNGFRFYVGLIFLVPLFRYMLNSKYGEYYREQFDRQLLILLWVQMFCIMYQFVKYGAGDHGGGSFGNGSSGMISMTVYAVSFYLSMRHWDPSRSYISNFYNCSTYIFLLLPTFFNETKVSLILFPLYFLLLMPIDRQSIIRQLRLLPFVLVLGYGAVYLYGRATGGNTTDLFTSDFYEHYLVGDHPLDEIEEIARNCRDGVYDRTSIFEVDIPRLAKLAFLPATLSDADGGMIAGAGLGQYKGGTIMGKTRFARDNDWILEGSVPMIFFIIIETGILGAIWFFTDMIYILGFRSRKRGCDINVRLMLAALFGISLLYADVFKYLCFCFPFIYIAMSVNVSPSESQES